MLGPLAARTLPAWAAATQGRALCRPAAAAFHASVCSRSLASAAEGGGGAATAAAAQDAAWRQRFDGVAPGSILRLGFLNSVADLTVRVGEHEAIELSSSAQLQAGQAQHPHREDATVGGCTGSSKQALLQIRALPHPLRKDTAMLPSSAPSATPPCALPCLPRPQCRWWAAAATSWRPRRPRCHACSCRRWLPPASCP